MWQRFDQSINRRACAAALYLASAAWVTGEVLDINGGAHLMRYPDLNKHVLAAFS